MFFDYPIRIGAILKLFASPSNKSVPAYPANSATALLIPIVLPTITPIITAPITVAKK